MSEQSKTLSFVGAALALLLVAWMVRTPEISTAPVDDAGKEFFPDFKDPLLAQSLEIVEYDEDTGTLRPFKVARVNGLWCIPSHENYPADAKNQLEQAATSVIDLKKLSMVSDSAADHELYGVVEPDSSKLSAGATGVGKRVTLEDASGTKLAQFIIGKPDKDRPDLHYVRVPGQDRVYKVAVKTDKLSTKFENWIESDLLKLNAFDVKQVTLNDHSVDELNMSVQQRGTAKLDYDNKESKWKVAELKSFSRGDWEDAPLAEDEELDSQKLNDLKTALDDLKIVDVAHKPQGLSSDLRGGEELIKNREAAAALSERGFYFARIDGNMELFSNEGEIRCGMNDGVEYILRFGEIAGRGKDDDADPKEDAKSAADSVGEKSKDAAGVNRFIMVSTRFNQDLIPKPELQPLPDGPAPSSAPQAPQPSADAPAAEGAPAAAPPADAPQADAPQARATRTARDPADDLLALADDAVYVAQKPAARQPAAPAAKQPAAPPATSGEEKPAADAATPSDAATTDKPSDAAPGDKPADAAPPAAPVDPKRKQIEDENKRKQDDYDKKVKDGEARVKELNDRFADWYYVISNKTYQKIHLNRDGIIKKKAPADAADKPAGDAAREFNPLENLPRQP